MSEPNIDPKWNKDREFPLRRFLVAGVPVLLIALAVLLSPFKSCNSLGEQGVKNVYSPGQQDIGFVKKSNDLFKLLLQKTDTTIIPVDLESLNKHYLAFEFDLPYAADNVACIEGADLRVVGIHQDYIPEEYREFFFNSRLPQLLKQQSEKISETYFKITLKSHSIGMRKSMSIKSVELIPSMFKVALGKDPWRGTIYAKPNCLFSKENSVFLTLDNVVIPIHKNGKVNLHNSYNLYVNNGNLYRTGYDNTPLDFYQYYLDTYHVNRSVSFILEENRGVHFCCVGDSLIISSRFDFNHGKRKVTAGENKRIHIEDGEKLVFYNSNNRKLAEFTINIEDPSIVLSSLTHTTQGTSRYVIPRNQTDLFTQQMIRGFCRSLSNKDSVNDVHITLDPLLSREFEIELKKYLNSLKEKAKNDTVNFPRNQTEAEFDISLTIMDMKTGQVLACPFYVSQFDKERKSDELKMATRNVALCRRSLGSTFKPLVALAAVQTNSSLLNLKTEGMYSVPSVYNPNDKNVVVSFHGHKTKMWARSDRAQWNPTDFETFIAESNDVYPVSLAALAMSNAKGNFKTLPADKIDNIFCLKNEMLHFRPKQFDEIQSFPDWLALITGANYDQDVANNPSLFKGILKNSKDNEELQFSLSEVSPDPTNLHYEIFKDETHTDFRDILVPWVLGQGGNEWSCLAIAEAWSRMISKRNIKSSYVQNKETFNIIKDLNSTDNSRSDNSTNSWNGFLDKFEAAQKKPGTLKLMHDRIDELNKKIGTDLILFSKTGTPDSYTRDERPILNGRKRYLDVGLYTFALVDKEQVKKIKNNEIAKGVVCVIRITRTYKCNKCNGEDKCNECSKAWGFKSTMARDFFTGNNGLYRLEKLYSLTQNYF